MSSSAATAVRWRIITRPWDAALKQVLTRLLVATRGAFQGLADRAHEADKTQLARTEK
ncbi:Uncharacterised protein [Klebsiella pneumoniae subsp. rhinoscleromatis]|nr:Uncharacterised protein [Klebsiella pneumoniae subsp. rhinoscleromatis]